MAVARVELRLQSSNLESESLKVWDLKFDFLQELFRPRCGALSLEKMKTWERTLASVLSLRQRTA